MERIDGKRLEAIRNYRGMSISDIVRKLAFLIKPSPI